MLINNHLTKLLADERAAELRREARSVRGNAGPTWKRTLGFAQAVLTHSRSAAGASFSGTSPNGSIR